MAKRLWVFDLDGTLMDTTFLYGYSYLDAARVILDELGGSAPHVSVLVNLIRAENDALVDAENPATGRPFKYDRRRFPTALQDTYLKLCDTLGRAQMGTVLDKLWAIGDRVFDPSRYPGVIRPEAVPLLRQIQRAGDFAIVLTKGDPAVQNQKLAALMAAGAPYATDIVVEDEKSEAFRMLQELHRASHEEFIAVGDTYDADIAPALKLGYRGIWLATESWQQIGRMEELEARAKVEGVMVIHHLRELFPLTEGPLS